MRGITTHPGFQLMINVLLTKTSIKNVNQINNVTKILFAEYSRSKQKL